MSHAFAQDFPLKTGSGTIRYVARNVRKTATGPHAEISILFNSALLAKDEFNITRHKERVTLANAAHQRLNKEDGSVWTKDAMLGCLTDFTDGLWEQALRSLSAIQLSGGAAVKELEYWLDPWIIKGGGTILFAPKGAGKTYIGLLVARCIEFGIDTFWPVTKCKVLFVQLERSKETFGRRIAQVNYALGLPVDTPLLTLAARGKSLADVIEAIKRHVEEDGVELVIIDSISRSGAGKLTEDVAANSIMDQLNAAAPSWLALGHTNREGVEDLAKAHLFGSVMFENAADVMVQQTAQRKKGALGLMLKVVDANDIETGHTTLLALDFDPKLGLQAIREAKRGEFPELVEGERFGRTDQVRMYLEEAGQASASAIASATGIKRTTVSSILRSDMFVRSGTKGKEVLFGIRSDRDEPPEESRHIDRQSNLYM